MGTKTKNKKIQPCTTIPYSEGVYASAGAAVTADDIVYVSGATNAHLEVTPADADAAISTYSRLYIAKHDIPVGLYGVVLPWKLLTEVNTFGSVVGNPVYLSNAAGGWSLTPGTIPVIIGEVLVVSATVGIVLIDPQNVVGPMVIPALTLVDNLADALSISEGANLYQRFVTTNGAEAVRFDKTLDINERMDVDYAATAATSLLDLSLAFNHASNLFTGAYIHNAHGATNRDAGAITNGAYVLVDSAATDNAAAIYRAYCAETDGSGGVHAVLHHGAGFTYTIDSASAADGENLWVIPTNVADAWTLYDATAVLPVAQVVSTTGDLHFSVFDGLDSTARRVGGRISERAADSAALVGVNGGGADAETVIDTVTIPASAIKAGSRLKFKVTARITVGATAGTLQMAVRLGGVAGQLICQSTPADPGAANQLWEAEGTIIGRAAPGAAAAVVHEGKCASLFFTSGAAHAADFCTSVIANQATNGALTLVVTGLWDSATNDAVVVQNFSVDAVG